MDAIHTDRLFIESFSPFSAWVMKWAGVCSCTALQSRISVKCMMSAHAEIKINCFLLFGGLIVVRCLADMGTFAVRNIHQILWVLELPQHCRIKLWARDGVKQRYAQQVSWP